MTTPTPPITTRAEFTAAIRWGFEQAVERGARRIVCVDPGFADWPLDDPALHELLTAWARRPLRRLVLLASSFDTVPRSYPRFTAWRANWAHVVDALAPAEGSGIELPTLLLDDGALCVRLIDRVHWRGRVDDDARYAHLQRDEVDAILQRSEPAFPVVRLGL